MKRIKIMGLALVAVFAMTAALAGTASAAVHITFRDSTGVLPANTEVTAISTNLVTTTSAGNLECEKSELPGISTGNGTAKVLSKSTEDREFGNFEEEAVGPGACKTSVGIPAFIQTIHFPWTSTFQIKLGVPTVTTKGPNTTEKIAFNTTLAYPPLGEKNKCQFTAGSVKSTFTIGKAGEPVPVELKTVNQKFKLNKTFPNTASICAKEGLLNGNWELVDSNGAVSAEE